MVVGAEQGRDRCRTEISRFLYIHFGVAKSLNSLEATPSDSGGFSVHPPGRPDLSLAPRRGRCGQCYRKRITAEHHHQDQPPDRPLAVGIGPEQLGDIPNRCGLGLDLLALGTQGGLLGLEIGEDPGFVLKSARRRLCTGLDCPVEQGHIPFG
jgi:hypothetical protein